MQPTTLPSHCSPDLCMCHWPPSSSPHPLTPPPQDFLLLKVFFSSKLSSSLRLVPQDVFLILLCQQVMASSRSPQDISCWVGFLFGTGFSSVLVGVERWDSSHLIGAFFVLVYLFYFCFLSHLWSSFFPFPCFSFSQRCWILLIGWELVSTVLDSVWWLSVHKVGVLKFLW